jgi:hypothetical protein
MKHASYGKLLGGIVAAWFAFALIASAFHLFVTDPGKPPIPIALGATLPVLLFVGWYAASKPFREFALGLNPQAVTLVHTFRIVGFSFLVLYTYHILPGIFALPAGWGDIAIGATAPLAAWKLARSERRRGFITWQLLGMADLVNALSMGALVSIARAYGAADFPMAVLPLSLIPTFGVPLLFILHIISIRQALQWKPTQMAASETLRTSVA